MRSSRIRILLLGAADVGKTAFVVRLVTRRFIGEYDQNKETVYTHRLGSTADRDEVFLELLDSSNNADDAQLETNIRWADGFILLFSITDHQSFQRLDDYLARITQIHQPQQQQPGNNNNNNTTNNNNLHHQQPGASLPPSLPVVLVANKADCPTHARRVSPDDCRSLAASVARPIYELSVADGPEDVIRVVDDVVRQVAPLRQSPSSKGRTTAGTIGGGGTAAGGPAAATGGGGGGQPGDRLSAFTNVKRVLKEKIYKGSRSDTWMTSSAAGAATGLNDKQISK
jgi:hypothetical protein